MDDQDDRSAQMARGEAALEALSAAGYARIEPPILQPASLFLDQSGEDIRGRLYLTRDMAGQEFCLRPEYTIPVFCIHLSSEKARGRASYSYLGPVFRYRAGGPSERLQVGLESFGRSDREAADAEIFAAAFAAAEAAAGSLTARIGDVGLFLRFLESLRLPQSWARRIRKAHSRGQAVEGLLASSEERASLHDGVLAALANADRGEARALVEDLIAIAGFVSVGGRSAAEIAERYLEKASARAGGDLGEEQREALRRFLEIEGDPDASSSALRALARDAGLDLDDCLDEFDARLNFIVARGVRLDKLRFSSKFGRQLDYYTGFVFEASRPDRPDRPVLGGGRYDALARALGAAADVPAVGAAIWCERLVFPRSSDEGRGR